MIKELGIKLNSIFKKVWGIYIIIGLIFLIISGNYLFFGANLFRQMTKNLGIFFLFGGVINLIYSLSEVSDKRFCWGEIFFRGSLEIFSGWLILWEKINILENKYRGEVNETVRKLASTDVNLKGYFIIFYIGLFLIFKGLVRVFTKVYTYEEKSKMNYSLLRFLTGISGLLDFSFGVSIMVMMYLNQEKIMDVIALYIFIESIFKIMIGIVIKLSFKKIQRLKEKEKEEENKR